METGVTAIVRIRRLATFLICLAVALAFALPLTAHAEEPSKTVRVGWFDSSFYNMDEFGCRSGYAYEYQLKVAAYTGWTYEYVNGSWSELMKLLEEGKIDLMSDVSYKPEREKRMLFPTLPMGTEEYYLYVSPNNHEIDSNDYATLNGKKVGVNEGSVQADFLAEWARAQGVEINLVGVTNTEAESLAMLETGELDAYVTVDSFVHPDTAVPVWKIGSSDYFFAVNKNRPDLLNDLNSAMSKIQDENRYYNQQMFEKHVKRAGANVFLTSDEANWLADHGTIRVGYVDNYLAFCAEDKASGTLTGALKDYLAYASDSLRNAHVDFKATAYPTADAAFKALQNGEIDCAFPSNLGGYDGETLGLVMTPSMTSTDVYAVVRETNQNSFLNKEHVVVAVNEGNPNYDAFLRTNYPSWRKVYYPTTEDCLKAVAESVADCVLVSNYRYSNIARLCEKYHLTAITTGVDMDYFFAVNNGEMEMYSVLTKLVNLVPSATVNAAMSHYATEDAKLTLGDFIVDNLGLIMVLVVLVLLVILVLLARSMRAEKKASELISATETDMLTGLYNRDFFFQYANRMYHDHPEKSMDAIVLNIERFHSVNALNGREFGDQVLRVLGNEVRAIAEERHGIAGRFGADRFDIYCEHTSAYDQFFERLQGKLNELSSNASIQLRMGVMPWQEKIEPIQLFDRARAACSMARGHMEHLIIFDERARNREMLEQRYLSDLRHGLDSFEFEVYFQPQFDIQSEPPKLIGAEALVRWRHPELGMIPPDEFIPLFERSGQIGELDKYVWDEAARQIARWRDQYGVTIPVSVNLSRVDVFDPELESTLDRILAQNGLDHRSVKLEVTESAYTEDADHVVAVVESLRKNGYAVGMDDFGTGYSSLSMLSAMPIDTLKMDRVFIQNIEHDERDIQLVALIIGIASTLNIPVVAEGVETEGQMRLLKDLGCQMIQGYYFSRPLHASDFEARFIRNAPPHQ